MKNIRPFLWFNGTAREAARHYLEVFDDAELLDGPIERQDGEPVPSWSGTKVRIGDLELMLFDAGPEFPFTPAVSLFVPCETQEEVDRLWDALCEGGEPGRCGWLTDRFGVSWQIVPTILAEVLGDPDPAKAGAARAAMMTMSKLVIADLVAARDSA
jgi:predicted 3-demethylubiquinone-9 3-methyltransferase (glyoxalase superfamily)